jgi:hypothetical protein
MQTLKAAMTHRVAGQISQQAFRIAIRHETQLGSIFKIDDQVAGIVGYLDQKGERMAAPGWPEIRSTRPVDRATC